MLIRNTTNVDKIINYKKTESVTIPANSSIDIAVGTKESMVIVAILVLYKEDVENGSLVIEK